MVSFSFRRRGWCSIVFSVLLLGVCSEQVDVHLRDKVLELAAPGNLHEFRRSLQRLQDLAFGVEREVVFEQVDSYEEKAVRTSSSRASLLSKNAGRKTCVGTETDEGDCVCGVFQRGDLCANDLFARCRVLLEKPLIDASCRFDGEVEETRYDQRLDGDPPCVFVKREETVELEYRLECFVFNPKYADKRGIFSEEDSRVEEINAEVCGELPNDLSLEIRAVNFRRPFSDLRSRILIPFACPEDMQRGRLFTHEIRVGELIDMDEGFVSGGRMYIEAGVVNADGSALDMTDSHMSQNCFNCTSRVFLDVEGLGPKFNEPRQRIKTTTIIVIAVIFALVAVVAIFGVIALARRWSEKKKVQ